jgi:hypothetical protein
MQNLSKKIGLIVLISIAVLLYPAMMPAMAANAMGKQNLPIQDPGGDVIRSDDPIGTLNGPTVGTHPEVDILAAWLHPTNPDLVIEFNTTPIIDADHVITVSVWGDSAIMDYMIMQATGAIRIVKIISLAELDFEYWNPDSDIWQLYPVEIDYMISGNNITFAEVQTAIPDIADREVSILAQYKEDSTYIYTDVAPMVDTIPGFSPLLAIFGILMAIGIVGILQRSKSSPS